MISQYINLDGDLEAKRPVEGTRIMDKEQKKSLVMYSQEIGITLKKLFILFMKNWTDQKECQSGHLMMPLNGNLSFLF